MSGWRARSRAKHEARVAEGLRSQTGRVSCLLCPWAWEGRMSDALREQGRHRAEAHGLVLSKKRGKKMTAAQSAAFRPRSRDAARESAEPYGPVPQNCRQLLG